jgi:hypothetical protein
MPAAPTLLTDYSCAISRPLVHRTTVHQRRTHKISLLWHIGHDYTSRDRLGNHRSQHQTWTMNYDIATAPQVLVAVENCPWAELQDPAPPHRNIRLGSLWHESLSMRLVGEARRYVFQKLGRQVY